MKRLNKIKIKYVIISIVCIIYFLTILPTFMRYKIDVTANAVGYAKETRQSTYQVEFHNNGGTGTMEDMTITYNEAQNLRKNTISYTDYYFCGWNTEQDGSGTSYYDEQEINFTTYITNNKIDLYAQWAQGIAEVNGVYYNTLQDAINAVPNNTQTTVRLLVDTTEQLTINAGKNIVFNLGNCKITNAAEDKSVIENNGTISISNGILYSNGTPAVINNNSTGVLTITGGTITGTSTYKNQAIYNNGGYVEISGNALLSSNSTNRGTLHNLSSGIMKIKGGTIISNNYVAVINDKGTNSVEIGTKDGTISITAPIIQGKTYGINNNSSGSFCFYDGIIKGRTLPINNEDSLISDTETGYEIIKSEESINSNIYTTAYLCDSNNIVNVTFNPCSGTVDEGSRKKESGTSIGTLPIPTRAGYAFVGWFTLPEHGEQIFPETIISNEISFYAQWTRYDVAEINGVIYHTMQEAINSVPQNNTPTTITLLCNIIENIITKTNQNIIFDLSDYKIEGVTHNPVVQNNGTLTISNGTIYQNSDCASIDNHTTGTLIITGGNILSTNGRSAVFSMGNGIVNISGNPYIWSNCSGKYQDKYTRGTVMSTSSTSNITITGGTIISTVGNGVSNYGLLTIGEKSDGIIDITSPNIQGANYGISSIGTFNYYDGIIKGVTDTISGSIADQEDNTQIVAGTEIINGTTYNTAVLETISD